MADTATPLTTAPGKSDAQKAAEYRTRLQALLNDCADIANEASREGIVVNWAMGRDGYGLMRVMDIQISKPL